METFKDAIGASMQKKSYTLIIIGYDHTKDFTNH